MRKTVRSIKRRAFTLIELVMVIVILGIVSMIATDIIANMYKGYIQTKIINDLEQKTETLINQVSKRLQYRIKETMIARKKGTNNFLAMNSDELNPSTFDMVEWIGYDYESFVGEYNATKGFSEPGWSGFIDVDSGVTSNTLNQLLSSGSNLDITERTIQALSNGKVSLIGDGAAVGATAGAGATTVKPAIVFKCQKDVKDLSQYGWDHAKRQLSDHNYTLEVSKANFDTFALNAIQQDTNRSICEQYYLAWTAYALVPVGDEDDFNLTLRYNYQPWYGDTYDDGNSSVIAEHVSTFRVMQVGETLRVKVCIQDGNITGTPVGFCKEKAIF